MAQSSSCRAKTDQKTEVDISDMHPLDRRGRYHSDQPRKILDDWSGLAGGVMLPNGAPLRVNSIHFPCQYSFNAIDKRANNSDKAGGNLACNNALSSDSKVPPIVQSIFVTWV